MRGLKLGLLLCMVAASFFSSPSWAAGEVCRFQATGLDLNFGTLDPTTIAPKRAFVTAKTYANMAGDCTGAGNMTISIVGPASRQLVSGANTIGYRITGFPIYLPKPGIAPATAPPGNPNNGYTNWLGTNIEGIIEWAAYADAPAGNYSDSITISVTP